MYGEENEDFLQHILRNQDLNRMKNEETDRKFIPAAFITSCLVLFYFTTASLLVEGFQLLYMYVLFRIGLWLYDMYEIHHFKKELAAHF